MKQLFASLLLMFMVLQLNAQNVYFACGEQSGLWNYDTVFINCDVLVPSMQELQISSGTKVIFNGHYSINVQGNIRAIGQETDSIVFTVADTTGFHDINSTAGGWNGLRFEDTPVENDSSVFDYCVFMFGKAVGDSVNCYGGAMRTIRADKIALRHSRISNNYAYYWGGALYAFKTNLVIEHCQFNGNYAGNDGMIYGYGGAVCFVSSEPDLRFSQFAGNGSTGIGGAASFEYSRPLILNTVFKENFSGLGGALGFLRSEPNRLMANLLVTNNVAQFFGGGIANVAASSVFSNLTIANNFAAMGGGLYCNEVSNARLYNSILWGNQAYDTIGSQVWIWDVVSEPGFYNCNVQGGLGQFGGSSFIGTYENCTEDDPQFINPQNGDFTIAATGSCMNAGTNDIPDYPLPDFDLLMQARIFENIIDIGAYEYHPPMGMAHKTAVNHHCMIYPLPVSAGSRLRCNEAASTPILAQLFDLRGVMIQKKSLNLNRVSDIALSSVINNFEQLVSGCYILHITYTDGQMISIPFVK